jgi:hypothetical protein
MKSGDYDLVLSANHLPDGTTSSALINCLSELPISLFTSYSAGLFWLPVILLGVKSWEAGALKPEAFVRVVEEVIAMKHLEENIYN